MRKQKEQQRRALGMASIGAFLAARISTGAIVVVFGLALPDSTWLSLRARREGPGADRSDPLAVRLRMDSGYPAPEGRRWRHVHRVPLGFALMFVAGEMSGLLGVGSGAIKALEMDQAMRIPFKVSTPIAFGRHALVNDHLKTSTFFPFPLTGIRIAAALKSSFACL